jgi:hypothetical protein
LNAKKNVFVDGHTETENDTPNASKSIIKVQNGNISLAGDESSMLGKMHETLESDINLSRNEINETRSKKHTFGNGKRKAKKTEKILGEEFGGIKSEVIYDGKKAVKEKKGKSKNSRYSESKKKNGSKKKKNGKSKSVSKRNENGEAYVDEDEQNFISSKIDKIKLIYRPWGIDRKWSQKRNIWTWGRKKKK